MRLIKMFGLAALAAVAAMAFVGASSASATTALCKVHEVSCSEANQAVLIHAVLTSGTVGRLLNSTADILCLEVLVHATILPKANPLLIHILKFLAAKCGTDANHNNCTVESNASEALLWLVAILRTALNLGTATINEFEEMQPTTRVKCTIFGFIKIDCTYDGTGLKFEIEGAGHTEKAGKGMLTANESPASLKEGSGLCPEEASLDGLLEPSENLYITE
jgi:hypothetical protein